MAFLHGKQGLLCDKKLDSFTVSFLKPRHLYLMKLYIILIHA